MRQRNVFTSKRVGVLQWAALFLCAIFSITAAYTVIDVGRITLKTQKILVPGLPETLEGYTILHITDLNAKRFGPNQKRIHAMLSTKRYNAVCFTGDMVGVSGDVNPFLELLNALDTARPVFFISGDSDPSPTSPQRVGEGSELAGWVQAAQARGAIYLDVPAATHRDEVSLWFSTLSQLSLDLDTAELAYATAARDGTDYFTDVIARTKAARQQMRENDIYIVLSHNPVKYENMTVMSSNGEEQKGHPLNRIDLVLSGGTVGGQWRLPLVGPVWADGFFPDPHAVLGYRYVGNIVEYISGGLSTSALAPLPAFRLFNTPEMTLITLTATMDDDVLPDG